MNDIQQRIEEAKQQGSFVQKAGILKGINAEEDSVIAVISAKTVDREGEVVLPKAFEKDLDYYIANPVVLFAHNYKDPPIARMINYEITEDEFVAYDQFAVDEYPFAKTIFNLYKGGYMKAFSVGFQRLEVSDAEDEKLPGQTGVTYTRAELLEHSAVPIPANRQALVKIYEEVQGSWDKKIIGYLEKLIDQPQTLPCGHKAVYDYEGNVVKECPYCLSEKLVQYQEKAYYWDGEQLRKGSAGDGKFFIVSLDNARTANIEQEIADIKRQSEVAELSIDNFWLLSNEKLVDELEKLATKHALSYIELAEKFSLLERMRVVQILSEKMQAISKPYPNEHSCRLRPPEDFQQDSFRRVTRVHEGKEYSVIIGKLKGQTTMTEQAYRYDKEIWESDIAKTHCEEYNGKFEPAVEEDSVKSVVPYKKYPLSPRDATWSFSAADGNAIIDKGGWALYRDVHTWYNPDADENNPPEKRYAYKLPHHKISGEQVKTYFRGCAAAMVVLMGGRGGVDIPESERRSVYNHLAKHYTEYDVEPPEFREYTPEEIETYEREVLGVDVILAEGLELLQRVERNATV